MYPVAAAARGSIWADSVLMANQPPRRFPPPWRPGGYVVRDANGQGLAYITPGTMKPRRLQAKVLTRDEAYRIAISVARLRAHT
jgi:hypothetical protein